MFSLDFLTLTVHMTKRKFPLILSVSFIQSCRLFIIVIANYNITKSEPIHAVFLIR